MIKIKRGATFAYGGTLTLTDDGVPVTDLTGYVITGQVKKPQCFTAVGDLTVAVGTGTAITLTADTSEWPLGVLCFDLRVQTPGGEVVYTPTAQLECVREITE